MRQDFLAERLYKLAARTQYRALRPLWKALWTALRRFIIDEERRVGCKTRRQCSECVRWQPVKRHLASHPDEEVRRMVVPASAIDRPPSYDRRRYRYAGVCGRDTLDDGRANPYAGRWTLERDTGCPGWDPPPLPGRAYRWGDDGNGEGARE